MLILQDCSTQLHQNNLQQHIKDLHQKFWYQNEKMTYITFVIKHIKFNIKFELILISNFKYLFTYFENFIKKIPRVNFLK